ncbi:MAG: DUF72 domain-containing protein [Massilia sp.]
MDKETSVLRQRLLVGCASWAIPRVDAPAFAAEGSALERYASVFGAVEINSSFYRPHRRTSYERWAASVPAHFRFAVKLPKTITHEARLIAVDGLLDQFAQEAGGLGEKLGCVLVQLPPSLALHESSAAALFAALAQRFGCLIACEARHESWFSPEATALMRQLQVTRVIADPPKGQPGEHVPTTATIYARLHGTPRVYYSSYEGDYLAQLGRDMATHARAGRTVWTIFDNTAAGAAVPNALAALAAAR